MALFSAIGRGCLVTLDNFFSLAHISTLSTSWEKELDFLLAANYCCCSGLASALAVCGSLWPRPLSIRAGWHREQARRAEFVVLASAALKWAALLPSHAYSPGERDSPGLYYAQKRNTHA